MSLVALGVLLFVVCIPIIRAVYLLWWHENRSVENDTETVK